MDQLFSKALTLLTSKNLTTLELRQQLESEFSSLNDIDTLIDETINKLNDLHLINDNHIAESLARRYSHKGDLFIKRKLSQKGISDESIELAIQELEPERNRALSEARKKLQTLKGLDIHAIESKLVKFLSGRAFSSVACFDAVKTIKEELP